MRILIIEDEKKTASYLRKGLSESGYQVEVCESGDKGIDIALDRTYDLIVLDVLLPGMDGWSVLREIRKSGKQTPVIFLTARDTVPDRVRGLELGADDYLVKPFAFTELLSRIRAVLRRPPVQQSDVIRVADLEIDFLRHKARRAGVSIDLTAKEFLLLALLARRAGEVLSRTIIEEEVWDMNFESDTNVVDVAIRRLRKKIDDPFQVKLIQTIRGVGYRLEDPRDSGGKVD